MLLIGFGNFCTINVIKMSWAGQALQRLENSKSWIRPDWPKCGARERPKITR